MKKVVIGGIFLFVGTLITLPILIAAALYIPNIYTWRGSKLWFAIFGSSEMGSSADSLFLGIPFVVGMMLFAFGLVVLLIEYFKTPS